MVIYLTRSHPALNITFQLIFVVKIMGQASKQLSQFVSDDSCANNFAQKKTRLVGMVLTSKITNNLGRQGYWLILSKLLVSMTRDNVYDNRYNSVR